MSLVYQKGGDRLYGRQALVFQSSDHSGVQQNLELRVPLQRMRPRNRERVFHTEAWDFSASETVVSGQGSQEILADIRHEPEPQRVSNLLRAGQRGSVMSFYPDVTDPEWVYDVEVNVGESQSRVRLDQNQGRFGREVTSEIQMKRADGSEFGPEVFTGMLLLYKAGDSLLRHDFTSGDSATYTAIDGSTQTAGSNVARDGHWTQNEGGDDVPALVVESDNTDQLDLEYHHVPREGSIYMKFKEGGQVNSDGTHVQIGTSASSTDPALYVESVGSQYQIRHHNGSSAVTARASTTPSAGSFVELNARLYDDGAVDLEQAIDGGSSSVAAKSGALALSSRWSGLTCQVGVSSTSMELRYLNQSPQINSMQEMRNLR